MYYVICDKMNQKVLVMGENLLPSLMGDYDDEGLISLVMKHAKYFTVIQMAAGKFMMSGRNYDRYQVDTIEEARQLAKEKYEENGRSCLIYGVADFAGANNFSRPVDSYPATKGYKTRAQREKEAKEALRLSKAQLGRPRKSKS